MLVVKNTADNTRPIRNMRSIPRLGRLPGGEHGKPLQFSSLENPMDRGVWLATVHRVVGDGDE